MKTEKVPLITAKYKGIDLIESQTILAMRAKPRRAEQAELLGITERALRRRINKYNLKERITAENQEIMEHSKGLLITAAPKAIKKQVQLMDNSKDERIQLEASEKILKRAMPEEKDRGKNNINIVAQKIENYNL